jgi:phosphatidyl-myo-inositol alpha-mannosyltransferase
VRIVLVSPYDLGVAGGVQAHVVALARALRAAGDEVHVLGPGRAVSASDEHSDGMTVLLGGAVAVPANGSRAPVAIHPAVVRRTRQALRRLAPDIVHVHEPLVPLVGPAAALLPVAPTVLTFHAHAERGPLIPAYRALRPLGRRVVAAASGLTAVSAVAAGFHATALGIDAGRLRIVPNGVDVARFAPPCRPAPADLDRSSDLDASPGHDLGPSAGLDAGAGQDQAEQARVVLFVGRLEHRKGPDVVLEAFLRLARTDRRLLLRIAGDGPLAPQLQARLGAGPSDVAERVVLLGRVDADDLTRELSGADVVAVPSRGGESFGIVLLEAMAAGAALVASDIGGYRDVARAGQEALLVPPDDPAALAAALSVVLAGGPEVGARIAAGRSRAAAHDWTVIATTMREVYRAAVRTAGGGSEVRSA